MLFPFLVATDGLDPDRADAHTNGDDEHAPESLESEASPEPLSPRPKDVPPPVPDEPARARYTYVSRQEDPEAPAPSSPAPGEAPPADPSAPPPEPVALVPAATAPPPPSAPDDAVRAAMRDATPEDKSTTNREARSPAQRFVLALLLIAAAALIGYVLSRPSGPDMRNPDAVARSVEAARQLQFVLDTAEPLEARRLVRNEFGWRVGVPIFPNLALRGVAVASVARDVEVPVFLYADAEDQEVAVFVYSYALFDQIPDRLTLARADLDDLAHGEPVRRPVGPAEAILWRDRDDIYIAVTALDARTLIGGLSMAR